METDRPDFTEGTATVAVGGAQIEGGATATRVRGGGTAHSESIGEVLVRLGVAPRAEARVALNSYELQRDGRGRRRGLDDVGLGIKWRLHDEPDSVAPATSLLLSTTLPTGARDIGAPTMLPEAKLAFAWTLGDRAGLGANAFLGKTSDASSAGATLSLGFDLAPRIDGFFEWYALRDLGPGGPTQHSLDGGLTFAVTDALQLDARVGVGVGRSSRDQYFGIGVARRWTR